MNNKNLDQLHHVSINVADIESSVNWYKTSFNCDIIKIATTFAMIEFNNIILTLVLPSQNPPHIAIEREDAETLGELRIQNEGLSSTFISDPSGCLLYTSPSPRDRQKARMPSSA